MRSTPLFLAWGGIEFAGIPLRSGCCIAVISREVDEANSKLRLARRLIVVLYGSIMDDIVLIWFCLQEVENGWSNYSTSIRGKDFGN